MLQLQQQIPSMKVPVAMEKPVSMSRVKSGPPVPMARGRRTFSQTVTDPTARLRRSAFMNPSYIPTEKWMFEVTVPPGYTVNKNADPIDEFYRLRNEILRSNASLAKEFEFNRMKVSVFLDENYQPDEEWYLDVELPAGIDFDGHLDPRDDFHRIRYEIFQRYPQLEEIYRDRLNRQRLSLARAESRAASQQSAFLTDELRRSDSSAIDSAEEIYPDYAEKLRNSPTLSGGSLQNSLEFLYYSTLPHQNPANFVPDPVNPNLLIYIGPSMEQWMAERNQFLVSQNISTEDISFPAEQVPVAPWNEEDLKDSLNEIDTWQSSQKGYIREKIRALTNVEADPILINIEKLRLQQIETSEHLNKISHDITRPVKYELVDDILKTALEIDQVSDLETIYHFHPDTYFFKVMKMAILYIRGEIGDADDHFTEDGKLLFNPEDFADFIRRNDDLL